MDRNDDASIDIEESITIKLERSLFVSSQTIYRVPSKLRKVDEKAYTPQVVSIGPLHHGRKGLRDMEKHKRRYLDGLIDLTKVSEESYRAVVRQQQERLRACYEELKFSADKFVEIILVDAAFIIVFLLRLKYCKFRVEEDCIFGNPWKAQDLWPDMLLFENQLPFFILKDLFEHQPTLESDLGEIVDIFELTRYFFEQLMDLNVARGRLSKICSSNVKHFVDFLRRLHIPLDDRDTWELQTRTTPNVTELQQAGVTLRAGSDKNLFDLKFENGVLEIPKLIRGEATEISLLNLLAFERSCCTYNCTSDYVSIMSSLINDHRDVELVVKHGIVDNEQLFCVLNKLKHLAIRHPRKFYFAGLYKELDTYDASHRDKLKAFLKKKGPTFSVIAVTTLVLTFIQTLWSIFSPSSKK